MINLFIQNCLIIMQGSDWVTYSHKWACYYMTPYMRKLPKTVQQLISLVALQQFDKSFGGISMEASFHLEPCLWVETVLNNNTCLIYTCF